MIFFIFFIFFIFLLKSPVAFLPTPREFKKVRSVSIDLPAELQETPFAGDNINFLNLTLYVSGKARKATGLEQAYTVDATELVISEKQPAEALTVTDQLVENTCTVLSLVSSLALMLPTCHMFFTR